SRRSVRNCKNSNRWVGSVRECRGMITLRAHRARQGTSEVLRRMQAANGRMKIVTWLPAKLRSSQLIDVYAIDALRHLPRSLRIFRFEFRHVPLHHCRRIDSEFLEIVASERRRCADDVTAEADLRRLLDGEYMSTHHIFDVAAPVQQFVHFQIRVIE